MATKKVSKAKKYGDSRVYEKKLNSVMERIGGKLITYDFGLRGAYVEFMIGGKVHRFEQTIERSQTQKVKLYHGSDCFAQVVMTIEDLARAGERGIFSIQDIFNGLLRIAAPVTLPECFKVLGFEHIPENRSEIEDKYRELVKSAHPDGGGSTDEFMRLQEARRQAFEYFYDRAFQ